MHTFVVSRHMGSDVNAFSVTSLDCLQCSTTPVRSLVVCQAPSALHKLPQSPEEITACLTEEQWQQNCQFDITLKTLGMMV